MTANVETVVLDSAGASPLTLQSGTVYDLQDLDLGLAARRPTWAQGATSDDSLLASDPPYDDAQMTATVQIFLASVTKDNALAALAVLTQKLQECSRSSSGLACTYTPADGSTTFTFWVKLAEYDGASPVGASDEGFMGRNARPIVRLKLQRRPFFYGPAIDTVTDDFSSNTIGNYTFTAGAGTLAVSGGQLVPSNTSSPKRFYRSVGGYDGSGGYYDFRPTLKFTTGASVSGGKDIRIGKRVDDNNRVFAIVGSGTLSIRTVTAGVESADLGTTGAATITTATSYRLRQRIEGNTVYAEFWTSAPTATGTPAAVAQYTLTGSAATTFGAGVKGAAFVQLTAVDTDWRFDDFEVAPNVWNSSAPLVTGTLPGVPGDVAAEAVLYLTDRAGQPRRFAEVGLEQRYYDSATPLQINSGSLTTSGFAGSSTTRSGSVNTNVIEAALLTGPVAICSTGALSHVGNYRVWVHGYATSTDVRVRLSWQDGAGQLRANDYQAPPQANAFVDLDVGTVSIPAAVAGTQQWVGQVEALGDVGDTFDVDYILLIPTEVYSKALITQPLETVTVFSAHDEFRQTSGVLNAKSLPVGGAWATSGATTDFAVDSATQTAQRSTTADPGGYTSGRFAIAGTATVSSILAQVDVSVPTTFASVNAGLLCRDVDSSNFFAVFVYYDSSGTRVSAAKVIAGAKTDLLPSSSVVIGGATSSVRLRVVVLASGLVVVWAGTPPGLRQIAVASDTALATGGTLATGKFGIVDAGFVNTGYAAAATRSYDNFSVAAPTVDNVIHSGREAQFRSDGVIRQDSAGTTYGPVPRRGADFRVPPAGAAGRTSRIATRALRNNPEDTGNTNVADSTTARVALTPRYLSPR